MARIPRAGVLYLSGPGMPGAGRRSPRLSEYDYTTTGAYFVSACTRDRACIFGAVVDGEMRPTGVGLIVEECWSAIPEHFTGVRLDAFVLMPNHVHGILWLVGAGHAQPLPLVVGSFKSAVSRLSRRALWQRSFYDRVIRNDTELQSMRQYIVDNPLKWAVDCENPSRNV
jgi:putative transposase